MGDYPCQKFRYGYFIDEEKFHKVPKNELHKLDRWYEENIQDDRYGISGFDSGLTYIVGSSPSSPSSAIVGISILADRCVEKSSAISYLGGYNVGTFDMDGFQDEVRKARQIYDNNPEIEEKIQETVGEHLENEDASVVTGNGWC